MQYILCVFTARKDAYQLYDYLQMRGVACKIVNTPREVSASCGIALQATTVGYGQTILSAQSLRSYVATYLVTDGGWKREYKRID